MRDSRPILRDSPWQPQDAVILVATMTFLAVGNLAQSRAAVPARPSISGLLAALAIPIVFTTLLYLPRALRSRLPPLSLLPIHRTLWKSHLCQGFLAGIALVLLAFLLTIQTSLFLQRLGIEATSQPVILWFQDPGTPLPFRLVIIAMAVLVAPVTEEMLYRGVLIPVILRNNPPWVAILLSSLFFAVMHANMMVLPGLLLVGAILAHSFIATGSLLTPVVMHMTFNAFNLMLAFQLKGA